MEFFLNLAWKRFSFKQYLWYGQPLEDTLQAAQQARVQRQWDTLLHTQAIALYDEWVSSYREQWISLECLNRKQTGWNGALWPTGTFPDLNRFFSTKLTFWFYSAIEFILDLPEYGGTLAELLDADFNFLELFPLEDDPDLYLLPVACK
ncbi:unnamed protein product [Calypogeia fissa]